MDHTKHSIGNPALLLLFFVGFLYLCIWSSSFTNSFNVFRKESLSTLSNTVSFNFLAYSFINSTWVFLNFAQKPFISLADRHLCTSRWPWTSSIQSFNGKQNCDYHYHKQGLCGSRYQSWHHHAWPFSWELLARGGHKVTAWQPFDRGSRSNGLRSLLVSTVKLLQIGNRRCGFWWRKGLHVRGFHQNDVEKNSVSHRGSQAWL